MKTHYNIPSWFAHTILPESWVYEIKDLFDSAALSVFLCENMRRGMAKKIFFLEHNG